MPKNVFVLGLDQLNLETLQALPDADRYAFHQLFRYEELQHGEEIPLAEQSKVIDEYPRFTAVDPFDDDDLGAIDLSYPYWIRPVKAFSSELAIEVTDAQDLKRAAEELREGIGRVGKPFEYVMDQVADLPPEIAGSTSTTRRSTSSSSGPTSRSRSWRSTLGTRSPTHRCCRTSTAWPTTP
ncbi:MAG: hypothetical protein WD080_03840 [Egibacteraceae bacterium]